jgi:dTDP-glucose 4,6-dehydratase
LDFASKVRDLCGSSSEIERKPLPVDDPKIRQPDITKAAEVLQWQPKMDLEKGLAATIDYFKTLLEAGSI